MINANACQVCVCCGCVLWLPKFKAYIMVCGCYFPWEHDKTKLRGSVGMYEAVGMSYCFLGLVVCYWFVGVVPPRSLTLCRGFWSVGMSYVFCGTALSVGMVLMINLAVQGVCEHV